jgi:RimJ/RimL family protein N-acetyltransferase
VNVRIETVRTWLRPVVPDDAPFLVELGGASNVDRYLGAPVDIAAEKGCLAAEQAHWQAKGWGMLLVIGRTAAQPIGYSGFIASKSEYDGDPELVCALAEPFRRQHLGLEVCTAVINWALQERGLPQVVACVSVANTDALGLIRRLGMVRKGYRPFTRNGVAEEVFTLRAEWQKGGEQRSF